MFKGKAIYNPSGKAGEYSYWACNFYVGCSNGCTYCYCKKGLLASAMGQDKPQLKKCFKNEAHALEIFERELHRNLIWERTEGIKNGLKSNVLFFSFTTDPMIKETKRLTVAAVKICNQNNIPVKILTKEAGYVYLLGIASDFEIDKSIIAIGFTLTGHDELEPNVSTNAQRILAMEMCKNSGFKTFASIEPIIDFKSSFQMIESCKDHCNLFKIGLQSGKKYNKQEALEFYVKVNLMLSCRSNAKAYWKDSFLKLISVDRKTCFDNFYCAVNRDYNMFLS